MTTAQITLTDSQTNALHKLALRTGKTEDQLIQDAVKTLIEEVADAEVNREKWLKSLRQVKGMWKDRDDLPDFEQLRKEWDRPKLWDEE